MSKVNNFDVMKVMSARNLDIRLSALDNLRGATKIKGGSEVKIGVAGDVVTGIALGKFVGGLILADSSQFNQIKSELEKSENANEPERLRQWVSDLQSGMYVNCVYCGHRYGPEDKVPTSMADALKKHIAQCPEHPMSALLKELKAGRDLVSSAFSHVSHGGPSREDAKKWLDAANSLIAQIEGAA